MAFGVLAYLAIKLAQIALLICNITGSIEAKELTKVTADNKQCM